MLAFISPSALEHMRRCRAAAHRLRCGWGTPLLALVLTLGPGSASAQTPDYQQVSRLISAGQLAQAQVLADQYLVRLPRDPQMRLLKALIQQESGQADEAMASLRQLIEEHPELPEPHNNIAVLHAAQGRFDEARAALEMAVRAHPGYTTALENLGDVYARLAVQAYQRALALGSTQPATATKRQQLESLLAPVPNTKR